MSARIVKYPYAKKKKKVNLDPNFTTYKKKKKKKKTHPESNPESEN